MCKEERKRWDEPAADKLMMQNQGKVCSKTGPLVQCWRSESKQLLSHQTWVLNHQMYLVRMAAQICSASSTVAFLP